MQKRTYFPAAFLLIALAGAALFSLYAVKAPDAVPVNAPAGLFSAGRAMQDVRKIARAPHAMGTRAHAQVRAYLVDRQQRLGLQPQVQEATVATPPLGNATQVGHVYNVVGRLPGTRKGKAILVMAHYDSQPNTPGAGDDGAGVAAVLEIARALRQGAPLRNDVIFLLTDGEEYGLFGAKAFLRHPWAEEVGMVINLEGRGNRGPSLSFEISPQNGWIVREMARAAPYPFASSLMYEVYRHMPNYTDFTVFKELGYSGINSGFIDGFVHYHKMTDSAEKLDPRSLQHHGSNALALVSHFGNLPLNRTKGEDRIFFNPLGSWLIHYPAHLNLPGVVLTTLLLVSTVAVGLKKSVFTLPQAAAGFCLYLLVLIVTVGLFVPLNALVVRFLPYWHSINGVYNSDGFFVAYVLLTLGFFLLVTGLVLRRLPLYALLTGAYLVWLILLLALFVLIPAAAYVLLFPLLFSAVGTLTVLGTGLPQKPARMGHSLILLLAALPAVCIIMPLVQQFFIAFSVQLPVASVALLALLAGLLLPLVAAVAGAFVVKGIPLLPLVLLLAGGGLTVRSIRAERPNPDQPLHSHVGYYLDKDKEEAYWASAFQTTDDWNRQFFKEATAGALSAFYPQATRILLKSKGEAVPLAAPLAEVLHDSTAGGERHLRLRLRSLREAAHLEMILLPQQENSRVAATLMGEPLQLAPVQTREGTAFYIKLNGLPVTKEVSLALRLRGGNALRLILYDQSLQLPARLVKYPMPPHVIFEQGRESNVTVVRKTYAY
jgi:hypothetical protein